MPAARTITAAARELQSAANRLALMTRNHNRDTILAALFPDVSKGRNAQARVDAQVPAMVALEADVIRLRKELGTMLDGVLPERVDPSETTEPTTKRKKRP